MFRRIRKDVSKTRIALLFLAVYAAVTQVLFQTFCPYAVLVGRPCPGCGLTRAGLSLLCGQPLLAARWNAAIFLWVPYLLYLFIFRYVLGKKIPAFYPVTIIVCLGTLLYHGWRLWTGTCISIPCTGLLRLALFRFV